MSLFSSNLVSFGHCHIYLKRHCPWLIQYSLNTGLGRPSIFPISMGLFSDKFIVVNKDSIWQTAIQQSCCFYYLRDEELWFFVEEVNCTAISLSPLLTCKISPCIFLRNFEHWTYLHKNTPLLKSYPPPYPIFGPKSGINISIYPVFMSHNTQRKS